MKRLLTILLLTFLYIIGHAQNPMLRNYHTNEYGGGTQNWAIDKTLDNRLLLANNDGLLEFDSHWWRRFPLPNYSNVRSVLFDRRRLVVWAGGSNEFGCYSLSKGNYVVGYHTLTDRLKPEEHDFDEIWRIHALGDSIVFQGRNRLFFLDANDSLTSISIPSGIGCSAVACGRLVLNCHDGIYELRGGRPVQVGLFKSVQDYLGHHVGEVVHL
ncbi:MAG: hypothetical protein IJ612_01885 [Prevotella sp.]|nr:hypothetical protein [Prevotella sp.]